LKAPAFLATFLALAVPAAVAVEAGDAAPALAAAALRPGGPGIALERLRGRVVYVDFWASWCVPCRLSMPALDAMQRKHGARGFTVVGVNKDVSVADAERFLARVKVGFTLVKDADDAIARAFDVRAMPSGYLVDRRGVVRHVHRGFTAETAARLEREVEALLAEAP
jgi:thiol-disulfide isomerase/thioredoxin